MSAPESSSSFSSAYSRIVSSMDSRRACRATSCFATSESSSSIDASVTCSATASSTRPGTAPCDRTRGARHRRAPVAPVDRRSQRALTRGRVTRAGREQSQRAVEARGQLVRLEHPHACRGELKGERKTVEASAHVVDVGRAAAVQAEVRVVRLGSLQEQRDGRVALVPGERARLLPGGRRAGRPRRAARPPRAAVRGWWPEWSARGSARAAPRAAARPRAGAQSCPAPAAPPCPRGTAARLGRRLFP